MQLIDYPTVPALKGEGLVALWQDGQQHKASVGDLAAAAAGLVGTDVLVDQATAAVGDAVTQAVADVAADKVTQSQLADAVDARAKQSDLEAVQIDVAGKASDADLATAQAGVDSAHTSIADIYAKKAALADLAAGEGASLVGYRGRTTKDKLGENVSNLDFGGVGDYDFVTGVGTDNTLALQTAMNYLANEFGGGRCRVMGRSRLNGVLTIPDFVQLGSDNAPADFLAAATIPYWPNALYVDPGAAISLGNGTHIQNLLAARAGLRVNPTAAQLAEFAGTPLLLRAGTVGHTVTNCMFLGFARWLDCADLSDGVSYGRTRLMFNRFDCTNGPRLHNMGDVATVGYNHGWPFLTTGSASEANEAQNARAGVAYELTGFHGFTSMTENFSYDYQVARRVDGTNSILAAGSIRFTGDKIDGYSAGAPREQRGYEILGNAFEISSSDALIQSQDMAVYVNAANGFGFRAFKMTNPLFAEIKQNLVFVDAGNVDIDSPEVRNVLGASPDGVTNNGSGLVRVLNGGTWRGTQNYAIGRTGTDKGPTAILGTPRFDGSFVEGANKNPYLFTMPAATTLPTTGNETVIYISGATAIASLANANAFSTHEVVLIAMTTINFTGDGNILTPGGGAVTVPVNGRVVLESDGVNFRISASVSPTVPGGINNGAVVRGMATDGQNTITLPIATDAAHAWAWRVFVNNVEQDADVDYSTDGSTTLHLAFAMTAGTAYRARLQGALG